MKKVYFSLENASEVRRQHVHDIDPPALVTMKNMYQSRSDHVPTLRNDLETDASEMVKISDDWYAPGTGTDYKVDFLNAMVQARASSANVYFSRFAPFSSVDGVTDNLFTDYHTVNASDDTSTATVANGGTTVTGVNGGSGACEWLPFVWEGCLFQTSGDSDTNYYRITAVNSNTEIEIEGAYQGTGGSGITYKIYLTHNSDNALYPLHLEDYTDQNLYKSEQIKSPLDWDKMDPIQYSAIGSVTGVPAFQDLSPTQLSTKDNVVFAGISSDDAADATWIVIGYGYDEGETLPGDGVAICGSTSDIDDKTSWVSRTVTTDTGVLLYDVTYDSDNSLFIACGTRYSGGSYTAKIYTSNDSGATWSEVSHDIPAGNRVGSIAYDATNNVYAIVTMDETNTAAKIFTSTNRTSWTQRKSETLASTVWPVQVGISVANSQFWANAYEKVWYADTSDVTSWTAYWSPNVNVNYPLGKVAYDGSTYGVWPGKYELSGTEGQGWYYDLSAAGSKTRIDLGWNYSEVALHDGTRFYLFGLYRKIGYTTDPTGSWTTADISFSFKPIRGHYGGDSGDERVVVCGYGLSGSTLHGLIAVLDPPPATTISFTDFAPLTEWDAVAADPSAFRCNSFCEVDGYVMMCSVREWDGSSWTDYPRRIRWTKPGEFGDDLTDWTDSANGAGTADLPGFGDLLLLRKVGHNVVLFETSAISVISPRGQLDDPWQYRVLRKGLWTISNPIVQDGFCWFIAADGLLYRTNGISVEEVNSAFDLNYSDFDVEDKIWLEYDQNMQSLVVYAQDSSVAYTISTATGGVAQLSFPDSPQSVVAERGTDSRKFYVGYDDMANYQLQYGEPITGYEDVDTDYRNHGVLETGWLGLVPVGQRTTVHQVTVHGYTEGGTADYPDVIVQARTVYDGSWRDMGDTTGSISVTSSSCDGTGTCFSHKIADGDDATVAFTAPGGVQADACRVYLEASGTYTLQTSGTDYTTSSGTITFTTAPTSSQAVYAYWDSMPEVLVDVGEYVYGATDEQYYRITTVTDCDDLVLDWYPSTTQTGYHRPAGQMADGECEVEVGLGVLAEGLQLRIIVVPRNSSDAPDIVKVTGISIYHTPGTPARMSDD